MNERRIREIVREEMNEATARTIASLGIKLTEIKERDPAPGSKTITGTPVIAGYSVTRDKAQQTRIQDNPTP